MSLLEERLANLNKYLQDCTRVVVAFSGGVDSSLLLKLSADALGRHNVLAVTTVSPLLQESELELAQSIAQMLGISHLLIEGRELESEEISANSPNRCYYCKRLKLSLLAAIAAERGYDWVLEGSNLTDTLDYRPGMRAMEECRIARSPFLACSLDKEDIRQLARQNGLPNWNNPAQACLASRIPYGVLIDQTKLDSVARAEAGLRHLGLNSVRVRHHGDIARIEINPEQFGLLADASIRNAIAEHIRACGFLYAALDLQGYRTGSLNEGLAGKS